MFLASIVRIKTFSLNGISMSLQQKAGATAANITGADVRLEGFER